MRKKITIVGAGNVGATAAHIAAARNLGDIVLVDIVEGLAAGKALDIAQAAGVYPFSGRVTGTTDWYQTAGSDLVIITSGLARKPGMSRDDLLLKNTEIVKSVTRQIVRTSPTPSSSSLQSARRDDPCGRRRQRLLTNAA